MYTGLLHTHSLLRYFVLAALIVVIIKAVVGVTNKQAFKKWDDKMSLYLVIFTHLQFVVGLVLYIINISQNRLVQFNGSAMKNDSIRYWTVEHLTGMLIAVVLITIARASSKRLTDDVDKHKKLLILNLIALLVIIVTLGISDRGILGSSTV